MLSARDTTINNREISLPCKIYILEGEQIQATNLINPLFFDNNWHAIKKNYNDNKYRGTPPKEVKVMSLRALRFCLV